MLAVCASASSSQPQGGRTIFPTGATIGASGFATVHHAPASPFLDKLPPPENRPKDERGYYAQLARISDAQAQPHVIDAIAARRKISRDEAWRRFRTCLERRETTPNYFDCAAI